jgi:hypothetical protein
VLNAAVTAWLEVIVTVQGAAPEHAPVHPAKAELEFAAAVSITAVPAGYDAAQLVNPAPQKIPPGRDTISPFCGLDTVRGNDWPVLPPL